MKTVKYILLVGISIIALNVSAQNQQLYYPPNIQITPREIPLNQMQRTMDVLQARYDRNKKYRDDLIDWITDLKRQTQEKQFQSDMMVIYNKLSSMGGDDFLDKGDELVSTKNLINTKIDEYNARVAEKPKKIWQEANDLLEKGSYDNAIILYNELIAIQPSFMGSYRNRGICFFNKTLYNEAISDLTKFINSNQTDAEIYEYRGWSFYKVDNFNSSVLDFEMQVKINPTSTAYYNLGSAKSEMGNYIGSIADYTKAINLTPDFSMAYNNRGWSKFKLKNYTAALADFNKAIKLDPENSVAYDSRQETKFSLGDLDGCLLDCNKALEIDPQCSNSLLFKGRVYFKKGNKKKACEFWEEATNLGNEKANEFLNKHCN